MTTKQPRKPKGTPASAGGQFDNKTFDDAPSGVLDGRAGLPAYWVKATPINQYESKLTVWAGTRNTDGTITVDTDAEPVFSGQFNDHSSYGREGFSGDPADMQSYVTEWFKPAIDLSAPREHHGRPAKEAAEVYLDNGQKATVPVSYRARFRGITHEGYIVVDDADGLGLVGLTPCCGASATGSEWDIVCRHCYEVVDPMLGGTVIESELAARARPQVELEKILAGSVSDLTADQFDAATRLVTEQGGEQPLVNVHANGDVDFVFPTSGASATIDPSGNSL